MSHLVRIMILLFIAIQSNAVTVNVMVGGANSFSPYTFTINPGDTVKWIWASGFHNTSSVSLPSGAVQWTNNITGTDTTYSYMPVISGLYSYTCTYHSGMNGQFFVTGCTYPEKPIITSANGNTACAGDTLQLSIPAQTGVSYQWIDGVTTIPLATSPILDVTASGNYKVLVNRCGVDSISNPFPVMINPRPDAGFTYTDTGLSFTFESNYTSPGPHSFLWILGDGSPDQTTINAYHTFSSAGNYLVALNVTDTTTGCSDTFSRLITVEQPVGIADFDPRLFSIFPNPATLFVYVLSPPHTSLVLMDLYGRIIPISITMKDDVQNIDVRMLHNGIYLLKISTAQGNTWKRIVIAH